MSLAPSATVSAFSTIHLETSKHSMKDRRAEMRRIITIRLRREGDVGPSPTRGGTTSTAVPTEGKKRVAYTKMLNHLWVIWVMELQAISVLFLCAFLHWVCATYQKKNLSTLKNLIHHLEAASSTKFMLYKYSLNEGISTVHLVFQECLYALIFLLLIITSWVGRAGYYYP